MVIDQAYAMFNGYDHRRVQIGDLIQIESIHFDRTYYGIIDKLHTWQNEGGYSCDIGAAYYIVMLVLLRSACPPSVTMDDLDTFGFFPGDFRFIDIY